MSDDDFLIKLIFKPDEPNNRLGTGEIQLLLAYVIELLKDLAQAEESED